jgi:hypothetical protein
MVWREEDVHQYPTQGQLLTSNLETNFSYVSGSFGVASEAKLAAVYFACKMLSFVILRST